MTPSIKVTCGKTMSLRYVGVALIAAFYATCAIADDVETRIYATDLCPATSLMAKPTAFAPVVAAILSAAISPLVDGVIDSVTKSITDAASDKDFPLKSPTQKYEKFYQLGAAGDVSVNPKVVCIIVARGIFVTDREPMNVAVESKDLLVRVRNRFRILDPNSQPVDAGSAPLSTHFSGDPAFYFETYMVLGEDKKSFAWRPQAIYVAEFASPDGLFGPKERTYKVSLSFLDLLTQNAFASTTFEFQGIQRGMSMVDCLDQPANSPCTGEKLGGLHGWFATRPNSDDTATKSKLRKATALTLGDALKPPEAPKYSRVADDEVDTKAALMEYCSELQRTNNTRSRENQTIDASCPAALASLKRRLEYRRAVDSAKLDQSTAELLWNNKCKDRPKTDAGLADCLQSDFKYGVETTGQFAISASIVETRPGNKVAKFFAPTLAAVAPVVKKAIVSELDPVERAKRKVAEDKAEQDSATASRDASLAASVALLTAQGAQADYDAAVKGGDAVAIITKQIALLKAQAAANTAYRAIGQAPPYPDVL